MIPPPTEDRPEISGQRSEKPAAPQERPNQDDRHPAHHNHQQQKNPNDEKDQDLKERRMEQGTKHGPLITPGMSPRKWPCRQRPGFVSSAIIASIAAGERGPTKRRRRWPSASTSTFTGSSLP